MTGVRIGIALLILSAFLGIVPSAAPTAAFADEGSGGAEPNPVTESLDSVGRLPWYDSETRGVAPVEVSPRVDDSVNRDSRWLPKTKQVAANPTPSSSSSSSGSSSGGSFPGADLIGWVVVAALMIFVVGLLVFAFLRIDAVDVTSTDRRAESREQEREFKTRLQNLPVDVRRPAGDLMEEADRLAAAERWDEAIIYLFGHRLLQLDRQHLIRLARGKTNHQYLAELYGRQELRTILRETVDVFEASYFGRHPISPEEFARIRSLQPQFESLLASIREAA